MHESSRGRLPRVMAPAAVAGAALLAVACGGGSGASVPAMSTAYQTAAQQQRITSPMLRLTACMRAHGIADFPDPVVDSHGVTFGISPASKGDLDPHSPHFQAAQQACQKHRLAAQKYIPPG